MNRLFIRNFFFYNCSLRGMQLGEGETGVIADKEVLQRIFDADFRDHSLNLVDPMSNTHYYHEFVKVPKDGLYLLNVVNPLTRSSFRVLIDTRIFPNFVLVEKDPLRMEESIEVALVMEYSLKLAAAKYKWEAQLVVNQVNEIRYMNEFWTAMIYADNVYIPQLLQEIHIENNFHGNIDNYNNYQPYGITR